ncbi:hypothetical protein, partial [Nonomuraea longispora]|uniref:hypothetical protein n=1 Tax=Nonomuraea longispora TaxID=1848320 RepID=UPI001C702174
MKIIFKQLFESSSKKSRAWCTTSYGSSIDIVFDLLILFGLFFGPHGRRSSMRTPTNMDTTSEDVNQLTLIADATRSEVRRGDNTRAQPVASGNSGKRLGPRSNNRGRSHLRLVPPPRAGRDTVP